MRGKGYGWIEFAGDDGHKIRRKLNYKDREEALANYIRRRSGRKFFVNNLADVFGVSERTIQKHLAGLTAKKWIERKACFHDNGKQDYNVIIYTGPKSRLTGNELTLEKILG